VSLVSDLFRNLADIAPTIVILGNHDCNLANSNRLDSLSPIIDNLNHPNLHYLLDSGVYKFGDIDVGVYSILGDRTTWPRLCDYNSEIKVGIYHGPINGAKTDTGHIMMGLNYVGLETFDGLDAVLLGDIHATQTMQKYSIEELEVDESELEKYMKNGWTKV